MSRARILVCVFGLVALVAAVSAVRADVFTVTFDELSPYADPIGGFYDGGLAGSGIGPGPNYGLTFDAGAVAVGDYAATGGIDQAINEPSPPNVATDGSQFMTIDSSVGITNGIYLYYSSPAGDAPLAVYDGPDATGNVLATLDLPQTPGASDPLPWDTWYGVSVPFSGTAYSIVLTTVTTGEENVAYDNITFGSPDAQVPEPCTLGLLAMGLVGLEAKRRRRV